MADLTPTKTEAQYAAERALRQLDQLQEELDTVRRDVENVAAGKAAARRTLSGARFASAVEAIAIADELHTRGL